MIEKLNDYMKKGFTWFKNKIECYKNFEKRMHEEDKTGYVILLYIGLIFIASLIGTIIYTIFGSWVDELIKFIGVLAINPIAFCFLSILIVASAIILFTSTI